MNVLVFFGGVLSFEVHLYLALLFRRDDFFRSDSSLACSFVPQGLFLPPGFIPSLLFSSAGIIFFARMHLYRTLLLHRDYFTPVRCISIWLFCSAGMIFSFRIHPWLALFFRRDDFFCSDSSLSCSFLPQGLFLPSGCIPGLLFSSAGIISSFRIHPWLALFFCRDDFFHPDASLNDRFCVQGCILPTKCIPDELFFRTEIITCLIAEKNQKTLYFQRLHPLSLKVQGS